MRWISQALTGLTLSIFHALLKRQALLSRFLALAATRPSAGTSTSAPYRGWSVSINTAHMRHTPCAGLVHPCSDKFITAEVQSSERSFLTITALLTPIF